MKYYRNTLNCCRLPAANANAMKLQAPDMRNSQNRNLCISQPKYRFIGLCGSNDSNAPWPVDLR